jgi:trk system potassium uptake protein TrkH
MRHILPVLATLGQVLMIFSAAMLAPLALSFAMGDGALTAYDEAVGLTLLTGLALWLPGRRTAGELTLKHGFLLVTLVWTVVPAFGALPLYLQLPDLSATDAYFEAVGALTTTGATVLADLDRLPASINFWRGLMQWLGGMGIIVLVVAVLPLLGVGGRQMFKAETPGPMKDTKLTPRMAETAKGLWLIYAGITLVCILCYRLAGMGWFDAFVHAFTTMSLGGFSSHDASFGYFDSPVIEAASVAFMLVAGINFATHFTAFRARGLKAYRTDTEAHWFLLVTLASCTAVALFLWVNGVYADYATALRYATFNVVSIATTTGYASTDFGQWPIFAPLWMLFLCSFATCSGSTGGGIKMARMQVLFLQGMRELVKLLHPQAPLPVKFGGQVIPNRIVFAVLAFMSLFGASITSFTFLLLASGLDFVTAFSAVIACINNTGPGLNEVGPATNFAALSDFQTWVCAAAMIVGRLELFTVLVIFTPAFWRK